MAYPMSTREGDNVNGWACSTCGEVHPDKECAQGCEDSHLDTPCSQCGENEAEDYGMCPSCLHDAYRSGWMPGYGWK